MVDHNKADRVTSVSNKEFMQMLVQFVGNNLQQAASRHLDPSVFTK